MNGLMQEHPLTLSMMLRRMLRQHPERPVVSGDTRTTWGEIAHRALRLMSALRELGVRPGDRVASFAWNSHRHLELYLAVPCLGAVLHTLNVRLQPDTLTGMITEANDQLIFVDASLTERFAPIRETLPDSVKYVVLDDDSPASAFTGDPGYEQLLAASPELLNLPEFDENTAALLCHTSGTTGKPKGVLYSHRSQLLHTFGVCAADGFAVSESDAILLLAPMFHVSGWGLPYAAALTGAKLVMLGAAMNPQNILQTISEHQVTLGAAVPTVWLDVAEQLDRAPSDISSVRRLLIGGAAPSRDLISRYAARGIAILQGWGMTETSPNASLSRIRPGLANTSNSEVDLRATQGVPVPGVEVRICAEDGAELQWDGATTGELEVRGPWVASAYLGEKPGAMLHDGWLRTGDVATIDPHGYIRVVDRIKDLVKSGGEWISSLQLEDHLTAHPGVREAAVIAVPHPRWGERPVAVLVADEEIPAGELRQHLAGRIPSWWMPDEFLFYPEIPRTGVGKYDKKQLRAQVCNGEGALNAQLVKAGPDGD